jgi:predicted Zn-dependent peptidase
MFVIYAATTPQNRAQVQSIVLEEIARVRDENISSEELERAKSMAIAANALENQTNASQAQSAAFDELYGLGYRNDGASPRVSTPSRSKMCAASLRST